MYWIYIIRCGDGSLYTGIATDVAARVARHQAGEGAKYTRGRGPIQLVYKERYLTRSTASKRENEIKSWSREKKLALTKS
jgi:predicted GIY-YIG superfamily endonuclease